MGLRITTNLPALNAHRNMKNSQDEISNSYAQLLAVAESINQRMMPQVLVISENLKGQIRSSRMAYRNASDGISMVQVGMKVV